MKKKAASIVQSVRAKDFTNADLFIEDPRIAIEIANYISKPYTGRALLFQPIESWISISSAVESAEVALQN